jgi:raffinose/stachyose/melibiose transport system permease protein
MAKVTSVEHKGARSIPRTQRRRFRWSRLTPYLYILPILILSGAFLYYSIGFTVYISFHKWDGLNPQMTYVGLANYKRLFADRVIRAALYNHLFYFFFGVGLQTVIGFFMAVLLYARLRFHNLFKAIYFLPVIMAPIIIAAIFRILLDANLGTLNMFLRSVGLDFLAVPWLGSPTFARWALVMVNVFEWAGFSMVLYYSGMLSIPAEIYEAAKIDGANFWQMVARITFPLVNGSTSILIILGIIGSLKTFDIVMLMTNGGPGVATEFLNTYLYKKYVTEFNAGYASAIGMLILVLAMTLSIIQIKMYDRARYIT